MNKNINSTVIAVVIVLLLSFGCIGLVLKESIEYTYSAISKYTAYCKDIGYDGCVWGDDTETIKCWRYVPDGSGIGYTKEFSGSITIIVDWED